MEVICNELLYTNPAGTAAQVSAAVGLAALEQYLMSAGRCASMPLNTFTTERVSAQTWHHCKNVIVSTSWFYGWVIKRRSAIGFIVAGIKLGQISVAILEAESKDAI